MTEREVQYWDSCLFINLITKRNPERVAAILEMWEAAMHGRSTIVLSTLVLTEVRPKEEYLPQWRQIVEQMLEPDYSFVKWQAVSRQIALDARDLSLKHPRR